MPAPDLPDPDLPNPDPFWRTLAGLVGGWISAGFVVLAAIALDGERGWAAIGCLAFAIVVTFFTLNQASKARRRD